LKARLIWNALGLLLIISTTSHLFWLGLMVIARSFVNLTFSLYLINDGVSQTRPYTPIIGIPWVLNNSLEGTIS